MRLLLRLLCVCLLFTIAMNSHAAESGYRVAGGQILHAGKAVQLRGVNWFGFETELHVAHGLWKRNWQEMIAQMQGLKINAVRIPVCPASLHGITPGGIDYGKNPKLRGLNSLQVLDKLVSEFNSRGMYVLIDHHRPDCHAISPLWYTADYSEKQWIKDLAFIAHRYRAFPYFLGIDLKNEPHGKATWGAGDKATDWNTAAERAAKAVLKAAPDILVFVEGIEDTSRCSDAPHAWWGGNLGPMKCTPLKIDPDHLVLSPHVYGPDVHDQPYFDEADFPKNMPKIWDAHFGQFVADGFTVVPGEFGGRYGIAGDPRDRVWQNALVNYLRKKNITSGFYWSWNPNSGDTSGLLQTDWQTVWAPKLALLDHFWFGTALAKYEPEKQANVPPPERGPAEGVAVVSPVRQGAKNVDYTVTTMSDWGAGYCVDVAVRNTGSSPVAWQFQMPAEGEINNLWNARYQREGANIRVQGADYNKQLAANAQTHFGYCAKRKAADSGGDLASVQSGQQLQTQVSIQSHWQTGYCADVTVHNHGPQAVDWQVALKVRGRVNNLWRGDFQQSGDTIKVKGKDYNKQIQPGQSQQFGFCADLK